MHYSSLRTYITSTENHSYPELCNAELTIFDERRNKLITAFIKEEALRISQSQRYMDQATLSLVNFLNQFGFELVCTEKTESVENGSMLSICTYYLTTPAISRHDDVSTLLRQICDLEKRR